MRRWLGVLVVGLVLWWPQAGHSQSALPWVFHSGATAVGNGNVLQADYFSTIVVQIEGTFVGTVTFEKKSKDASGYVVVQCTNASDRSETGTETSAPGYWECPGAAYNFRARVSDYTSGTIIVTGGGTTAISSSHGGGGGLTGWPHTNVVGGVQWAVSQATAFRFGGSTNYWLGYDDPSDGLQLVGVCSGVVNGCNYIRKLAAGKYFEIQNPAGASIFRVTADSSAITNATLDAEGTGNSVRIKNYLWRPFAACQAGVASTIWDLPASNAPTPACKGSNTTKGVLEFADGSTDLSTTITEYLNEDWYSDIDATIIWESASTSTNNVLWGIAIACAGPGANSDPAFTNDDFTADANNGTANTYNVTAANTVTTTGTCTAGKMMHIRVTRRLSQAGDTLAATAQAVGLSLKLREAQ